MIRLAGVFLSSLSISLILTATAFGGPVLDDLLNYPVVDQQCPPGAEEEGLHLIKSQIPPDQRAPIILVRRDQPVGQTIKLSDNADILWRIMVAPVHWDGSWDEGEELTFTLWDSPKKQEKYFAKTRNFYQKWFKWDASYDMHLPTEPGQEYYFELTHNGGGDGEIAVVALDGNQYERGQVIVGGQPRPNMDLYFTVTTKPKGDREENLRRLLDRFNYDHPLLEKAGTAYQAGELDRACQLILEAFGKHLKKEEIVWRPDPEHPWDPAEVESVITEQRRYRRDDGEIVKHEDGTPQFQIMDESYTWREVWPNESGLLRANNFFRKLGWAYTSTGDEAYAEALNTMMADFMQDNASPFEGGMRGGRWVAMFIAWRLGDAWSGIGTAWDAKGLTDDVKLAWLGFVDRMAHFAVNEPSRGNHANAVAEAVMSHATRFPLYKSSKANFEFGFEKLVKNSKKLFYDDGACREPAMNYHGYSLANLMAGLDTAREYGVTIPDEINEVVEKALAYTAYILKPDGQIPTYGDTNCEEFRPGVELWDGWREGEVMDGYKLFGREDLLYIATAGKKGKRPEKVSVGFPDIKHYIMRSDWGGPNGEGLEDALYMFFRAGKIGSHGHRDMNMITLHAYGRPLLIDPGRTDYGTPLMYELTNARSHSVLLVENTRMNHVGPELQCWQTNPAMDYIHNRYEELYPTLNHDRAVVFVRPDYFVMFDHVRSRQPKKAGLNFWLTPPEVTINREERLVHTNDPNRSNLLIKVLRPAGLDIEQRNGTLDKGEVRSDIPVVTFWKPDARKVDFATLLYPFPKDVEVENVPAKIKPIRTGGVVEVERGSKKDYIYHAVNDRKAGSRRGVLFDGKAGVLRTDNEEIVSIGLVEGKSISRAGEYLVRSRQPIESLAVRYPAGRIEVTSSSTPESLEIATFGRTKAIVNGTEKTISGEMFKPFE